MPCNQDDECHQKLGDLDVCGVTGRWYRDAALESRNGIVVSVGMAWHGSWECASLFTRGGWDATLYYCTYFDLDFLFSVQLLAMHHFYTMIALPLHCDYGRHEPWTDRGSFLRLPSDPLFF